MSSMMVLDYEQFDHVHLMRVVPIAQTRVFDQITVTVMSLELYEAGFIINLLHGGAIGDDPHDIHHLLGTPVLTITDEHGREYESSMRAGFGGSGMDRGRALCSTFVLQVTPGLPPDVGRLTFEMLLVNQFDPHGGFESHNIVGGPWTFDLVVPPDPAEGLDWPDLDVLSPVPTIGGKLSRVVPVGQRSGGEEAPITIYSLELFETGFNAVVRADWKGHGDNFLRMRPSGRDDLGGEYRNVNHAGGGGVLLHNRASWRMSYMFRPVIDTNASTLTLDISRLELISYNFDERSKEPGKPDITVEGTHEGPWTFEIGLGA